MTPHQSGAEGFLNKARTVIVSNLENEQFGVSELARALGMSRSNLHRKIKSVSGKSVSRFIREVRLNRALELLKDQDLTVSEVAFRVGFGSAAYFTKCFHDYFGFPPGEAAIADAENDSTTPSGPGNSRNDAKKFRIPLRWVYAAAVTIAAAALLIIAFRPFLTRHRSDKVVIAVLPFKNDSPDQKDDYIINGLMEEILNKLSMIDALSIPSRTTMELYRNSEKSLRQIGKELRADYILEGSATVLENHTRIRIQLIESASDQYLWSEPYEREISIENIFDVQEEVARAVTEELSLILNPIQKELIEKEPTDNLEAYNLYIMARDILKVGSMRLSNYGPMGLEAKELLSEAIILDTCFLDAIVELGNFYINIQYFNVRHGEQDFRKAHASLDSGLVYIDKVLAAFEGDQRRLLSGSSTYWYAISVKGQYYILKGMFDEAETYLRKLSAKKNLTYLDYQDLCNRYSRMNAFYQAIENYIDYKQLLPSDYIIPGWVHESLYQTFRGAGFPDLAEKHAESLLMLQSDTIIYYSNLTALYFNQGNYEEAIRYYQLYADLDPYSYRSSSFLARCYILSGDIDMASRVVNEGHERLKENGEVRDRDCIRAYIYMQKGEQREAKIILERDLETALSNLKYLRLESRLGNTYLHLARVYSSLGDAEKTLEYLAYLKNVPGIDIFLISELKDFPSFDIVRETPEYNEVLTHMETQYQKEHEKIERLLKNKGHLIGL